MVGVYEGWGGVARTLGPSEGGDAVGLEERVLLLNAEPRLLHNSHTRQPYRKETYQMRAWRGRGLAGFMRRLQGKEEAHSGCHSIIKVQDKAVQVEIVAKATSSLAASMYLAAVTRVLPCGWGTQIKTWTR